MVRYGVAMNISRTLFVGAALLGFALPLAANAQTAPDSTTAAPAAGEHHHHRGGGLMKAALAGITLSDDQKAQLKKLRDDFRAAHANGVRPDRDAMKQLREQMLGVLTPDQRTQYDANVKAYRDAHPRPAPTATP